MTNRSRPRRAQRRARALLAQNGLPHADRAGVPVYRMSRRWRLRLRVNYLLSYLNPRQPR